MRRTVSPHTVEGLYGPVSFLELGSLWPIFQHGSLPHTTTSCAAAACCVLQSAACFSAIPIYPPRFSRICLCAACVPALVVTVSWSMHKCAKLRAVESTNTAAASFFQNNRLGDNFQINRLGDNQKHFHYKSSSKMVRASGHAHPHALSLKVPKQDANPAVQSLSPHSHHRATQHTAPDGQFTPR